MRVIGGRVIQSCLFQVLLLKSATGVVLLVLNFNSVEDVEISRVVLHLILCERGEWIARVGILVEEVIFVSLSVLSTDAMLALLVLKLVRDRQCVVGHATDKDLVWWEMLFEEHSLLS